MKIVDFFTRVVGKKSGDAALKATWTSEGVRVEFTMSLSQLSAEGLLDAIQDAGPDDTVLGAYLAQLVNEGRCTLEPGGALIGWQDVYELQGSAEHVGALQLLVLPPLGPLRPILNSVGSLSDSTFELEVAGWTDGSQEIRVDNVAGAVATVGGRQQMLSADAWTTQAAVKAFAQRPPQSRTQHELQRHSNHYLHHH